MAETGTEVSRASLMRTALYYLGRFSASRHRLRLVLERKARRALRARGEDPETRPPQVEQVLDALERQGLLNDAAYAEARARALAERGTSRRGIVQTLRRNGIAEDLIAAALKTLEDEDAEDRPIDLAAAEAYVRRRRLGPWRDETARAECRDRDLAALARRGFSLDVALKAIDGER